MAISRNSIQDAILQRLKDKLGGVVKTFTRKNLTSDQLAKEAQPAIILLPFADTPEGEDSMPQPWRVRSELSVLVKEVTGQGEQLLELVDAVEKAFERAVNEKPFDGRFFTTLSGKVHEIKISGPIDFTVGTASGQSYAVLHLEAIVVP